MFIRKVTAHFLITVVGSLLLMQYITGNVVRTPAEEDAANKEQSAIQNFTKEIVTFVLDEYTTFANDSLYSLRKIFLDVIQDADAYEGIHWKYLQKEVEPFRKFLKELEKLEDNNDTIGKYDLLSDIADTMDAYNTTLVQEPRDEVLYIEKLLKNYGLEALVNELDRNVEHFVKLFKSKANEIWQQLPAEERGGIENLNDWLGNFENYSEALKTFESLYSLH